MGMGFAVQACLFAALWSMGMGMLPPMLRFMQAHKLTARNYDQVLIPVGLGLLLWLLHILGLLLLLLLPAGLYANDEAGDMQARAAVYVAAVSIVFFAGWLDDTIGDRTVKGWKGHWRRWRQDKVLTTGWLKAGAVGVAALIAVLADGGAGVARETGAGGLPMLREDLPLSSMPILSVLQTLLQLGLLLLMTNAFNLLDLRPGRCLKTFLAASIFLLPAARSGVSALLLLPAVAGALVLLPGDLRAKHMLGDAGANVLGFAAGCALIATTSVWVQAGAAVLLLALHGYAEKRSISVWIDGHRFMRWLDRWGRA